MLIKVKRKESSFFFWPSTRTTVLLLLSLVDWLSYNSLWYCCEALDEVVFVTELEVEVEDMLRPPKRPQSIAKEISSSCVTGREKILWWNEMKWNEMKGNERKWNEMSYKEERRRGEKEGRRLGEKSRVGEKRWGGKKDRRISWLAEGWTVLHENISKKLKLKVKK